MNAAGVAVVVLAAALGAGWATALVLAVWRGVELGPEGVALLSTLGGVLAGTVAGYVAGVWKGDTPDP